MRIKGTKARPFTPAEDARAEEMLAAGCTIKEIAGALGRSFNSVKYRVKHGFIGRMGYLIKSSGVTIPQAVLEEREHRLAAAPRDLSAALMGDPLPGYSALDRRANA